MTYKEHKVAVLRKFSEVQEPTQQNQGNNIWKQDIHQGIEITKRNQKEILELKNTINEIENFKRRLNQAEESVSTKRDHQKLSYLKLKK